MTPDELRARAHQRALDDDWQGIVEDLEAVRRAEPDARFGAMLANAYRRLGDLAAAEREYTRELSSRPGDTTLLEGRAMTRASAGAMAEALADMRAASAAEPESALKLATLADFEEQSGLPEKAAATLAKACALEPKHWPFRLCLMVLRGRMEDWGPCETDAHELLNAIGALETRKKESAIALSYRGWARFKLGKPGAREDVDAALKLEPNDSQALCFRGLMRAAAGDPAALTDFDASLFIEPNDPFTLSVRGEYNLRARGDKKSALADFQRAIALDPDHAASISESVRQASE